MKKRATANAVARFDLFTQKKRASALAEALFLIAIA
jgi:hypothetical protein